jgi:hypothetical protein
MDLFAILETFGLPVAMVIGLAFYIRAKDKQTAKEQKWIREELSRENRESFGRLESIVIKLIDAQKAMQQNQAEQKARLGTLIEIITMYKGGDTEKKYMYKKREDL